MAKELVYKVRIDFDDKSASKFGTAVDKSQETAQESIKETVNQTRRLEEANERLSQSGKAVRNSISGANQTLFSFGDIVNDSAQFQFGFAQGSRAIGNNIAFMAEQFSNVQTRAGGFTNALKAMGGSLLGPGGLILGINLAVTALTLFGDKLFGKSDSVANKAKEARKELVEFRKELDKFDVQFEQLAALQEEAFPDLTETQALKQQIQFAREIEGNLQNRLDAQQKEVGRLERQVDLFEKLQSGQESANSLLRKGLISQELAVAIAQDRVDVEGTLIQKRNQLQEATIEQEALQLSVENSVQKQVQITSKLNELEATRESQTFQALQNLTRQRKELQEIQRISQINIMTVGGEVITPEMQKQIEARRAEAEKTQKVLDNIASKSVPEASKSISETALEGIEVTRRQAEISSSAIVSTMQAASMAITALFGQSKAAAIADAIVQGALAVQRALASAPPPFNFALAATVGAATAAQIATIKNTNIGDTSAGSVGSGSSPEGFRSTTIDQGTRDFSSEINKPMSNINIELRTEADSKVVSKKAEDGRKRRVETSVRLRSD